MKRKRNMSILATPSQGVKMSKREHRHMHRPRTAAAAVVVVALVAGAAAVVAHATVPGKNGQIVYRCNGPAGLCVSNADGTGERNLTQRAGVDDQPDWSPDGSKVAFQRCREAACNVWTVTRSGASLRRIGRADDEADPAWAPDGKQIAYARGAGGSDGDGGRGPLKPIQIEHAEIYVMNANGGAARPLTGITTGKPFSADVEAPAWSPSGKQIVFAVHNSKLGEPANQRALFVINADGSEQRQLTPWSLNGGGPPDWSPDGKKILFRSVPGREQHGNLYTVNVDGSGLKQITRYPAPKTVYSGSFSPDGNWITFTRFTTSPYPSVFVMRANGTGVRRVSARHSVEPDWGSAP